VGALLIGARFVQYNAVMVLFGSSLFPYYALPAGRTDLEFRNAAAQFVQIVALFAPAPPRNERSTVDGTSSPRRPVHILSDRLISTADSTSDRVTSHSKRLRMAEAKIQLDPDHRLRTRE
jgi:hypothetical protein